VQTKPLLKAVYGLGTVTSEQIYRLKLGPAVLAFSPQLSLDVIAQHEKANANVSVLGCNPLAQMKVTDIADYMTDGKFSELQQGGNRIVIGSGLANKLGALVATIPISREKLTGRLF